MPIKPYRQFSERDKMQNLLRSKKGYILITSYMVMTVLIILGAALFSRSIAENNQARIARNTIMAGYAAEKGLSCAYYEIKRNSNWVTHVIDFVGGGDLIATTAPAVTLSARNRINPTDGWYEEFSDGAGQTIPTSFQVKTYRDPADNTLIVVLVKGLARDGAGNITSERLFVTKVSSTSMYDYFIFTPDNLWMHRRNFDAQGGKIQVNGNVIFGDYVQVTLGTNGQINAGGNFKYYTRPYVDLLDSGNSGCQDGGTCSKWYLRSPWYTANTTESKFFSPIDYRYINEPDGHVSGDRYGLYRSVKTALSSTSPPYEIISRTPSNTNPPLPQERFQSDVSKTMVFPNIYSCADGFNCNPPEYPLYSSQVSIDNKTIPNRIGDATSSYIWNKYTGEPEVDLLGDGLLVNYTNSLKQSAAWNALLTLNGLTGKLNKRASLAISRAPNIQKYLNAAQAKGIYLYVDTADHKLKARIGRVNDSPQTFTEDGSGKITAIYNGISYTIVKRKSIINTQNGLPNDTAVVNLAELAASKNMPPNGIIYSQIAVGLNHAENLSSYPLTTVGEENIFVSGPYNTATNAPSAAIGQKKIYTVSSGFLDNPPSVAPATLHNIEYPYVADPSNYYATKDATMPSKVTSGSGYVQYNISTIGRYGYQPEVLERWTYPVNINDPGGAQTMIERRIQGAQVKLTTSDFNCGNLSSRLGGQVCSWVFTTDGPCNGGGSCPASRIRNNPGWPWDMTTILGDPNYGNNPKDTSIYDSRYLPNSGYFERPPGNMIDNAEFIWLELANTVENFSNPCTYMH
ncbi:MAG: hypothetical protein Q8N14_06535 [Candidatus Omnitrophota bacterium]|nr:hypothetical protein [Candidatus Omnitrophota bacterium]